MDIRYVNPFVEGVNSVFQSMLSLEPRRCALKLDLQSGNGAALTSLVGISGQVQGVVALRFPSSTALQLAHRMRGTTMAEINEEVIDVVSQIANMIADTAKTRFNCDPPLELGLPTIVHGRDYEMKHPSRSLWLEVPFDTDAGRFTMELTFESN